MSAPALPHLPQAPAVMQRRHLSERRAAGLDAILAIVPQGADPALFAELPHAERWRGLNARASRSGGIACTTLGNARGTWAVLGTLPRPASAFETLTLAGRLIKEIAPREFESLAIAAPGAARGSVGPLEALASAALAHAFDLPTFRKPARRTRLGRIELIGAGRAGLEFLQAAASANNLARYLTALPPNVLDARSFRRLIVTLAREHHLRMRWLDERALARLGANAFLAVAAGNAERTAGIAHLAYRPRRAASRARSAPPSRGSPDVALIGKGILFDTGGTNLKPHRAMLDMHTDMAGSAVALAVLSALARLNAPIAADAWLAITENRIGPSAYRPQDVVRAANGITIQVIHTDAEGRMVLADTLALAGRTAPRLMLDFATLTGTCIYALTERMSGIFTNEPRLTEPLLAAGRSSGERVWSFPFDADYDSDLESKVADILQCAPEGKGDHILAARFLSRFVPRGIPWVHLDLSAAVRPGGLAHIHTDVTGFGVRYALELILRARVLDALAARPRARGR